MVAPVASAAQPDVGSDRERAPDAGRAQAGSQAPVPAPVATPPVLLDAGASGAHDADVSDAAVDAPDAAPDAAGHGDAETDGAMPTLADASADAGDGAVQPTGPAPGAAFSECAQHADCDDGLVCTSRLTLGSSGGYCTGFCATGGGSGSAVQCPQPSSGLVRAICQPGTMLCLLESCERSQCPQEMQCVRTETPIGPGQVIETYACQP